MIASERAGRWLLLLCLALGALGCKEPQTICENGKPGCPCTHEGACKGDTSCVNGMCYGPGFKAPDSYFYSQRNRDDDDHATALVRQTLRLKPGMRAADIGAGTGAIAQTAACQVGANGRVYATDIRRSAIETLEHMRAEDLRCPGGKAALQPVFVARSSDTGLEHLPDASLDLVYMIRVLIFDPARRTSDLAYLRKLTRLIKPGGRFLYYNDWVHVPKYAEHMASLFAELGFEPKPEVVPLPAHIPERTWWIKPDTGKRSPLYRCGLFVFKRPAR